MRASTIADLLQSADYADFLKGTAELSLLHSIPELQEFHDHVESLMSDHLRGLFQKHLFRLFRSEHMELNGFAMQILLEHTTSEHKEIRTQAQGLVDEFLLSDEFTYFKKLISFRRAFRNLSLGARRMATRLIGVHELKQAYSLILENFRTEDRELLLLTMEIYRRSRDTRGNRFLRTIAEAGSDEALSLKAIETLSELGNFFDRKIFKSHLKSERPALRKAALKGLHRLRGRGSLQYLRREFLLSKDPEIRRYLIELLSQGNNPEEVSLLLELWNSGVSEREDREIEWVLGDMDGQRKLGPILRAFNSAADSLKHKLIILLNEVSSVQCYEFYRNALRTEKNPFLLMSVMEAMAYYDRPESIPLLLTFMKDPEELLHYYAFSSIVRHNCIDLTEILETVALLKLPDERHHHQLILSVLAHQRSITSLTTFLQVYVLMMLQSSRSENRYLAYVVVGKFYLLFELKGVFDIFESETSELVIEEAERVFGEIFALAPAAFMSASPPKHVLKSESFAKGIRPTPSLLHSLFSSPEGGLLKRVSEIHPEEFREALLEVVGLGLFDFENLGRISLKELRFRDFHFLWERAPASDKVRRILLEAAAKEEGPRFGKFVLHEYLERGGDELAPYVSKAVNGAR